MDATLTQLATSIGQRLSARSWQLATAESCTGGWVAQVVTAIAGSSAWFERGFITYSNASKIECLGVPEHVIAQHGAVSEAVAAAMATGALARSRAHVSLAITGIAGPGGGSATKPVGTVCFAWALTPDDASRSTPATLLQATIRFDGDREAVRRQAVIHSLEGLLQLLDKLLYI